jgi:NADH dehydrogenase [ubiquinone] 1 alpha subcomplex assembly factor 1
MMSRTNPPIRYGLLAVAVTIFAMVYVAAAHPFSLSFKQNDTRWRVVLDGVMGGLSSGRIDQTSDGMMFRGDLRLENNGGFSQIRTPIEQGSFKGADGIEIEVRGDGRNYIFDARVANMQVMAGSYQHNFDTASNEWRTIRLPFTDFKFHYFGRRVPTVGPINAELINSLGVTLADKNPGGFELEIRAIRGYVEGDVYDERLAKLGDQLGLSTRAPLSEPARVDQSRVYADRAERLLGKLREREAQQATARPMTSTYSRRVMELCAVAIDRGAPLFNHGQHEACASVYEVTLISISHLSGERLGDRARSTIQHALSEGRHMHAQERAWHYRHVIDELMRMFSAHA